MKEKIKYYVKSIISMIVLSKKINKKKSLNYMAAELTRYTHSIEKGLSIYNIKLGFGHEKQKKMISIIDLLEKENSNYYNEIISMAISALNQYIIFHDKNNYSDDFIISLKDYIKSKKKFVDNSFGGTMEIDTKDFSFKIEEIESFFKNRHSIRKFTKIPVDDKILKKAIKLAQQAPSACNRQAVRVYVVDKTKSNVLKNQLSGIGGFAEEIDKFIIITGKISSYKYNEINQYIVSASIYAGYLSLTLHAYGLGACIIQRPVIWNKNGEIIKKEYGICDDEQIICLLGVGNIDKKVIVPISHRISLDEFASFIE